MQNTPELTVVGTSRQPLGLQAEQRFPVAPLAEPDAIELFERRARARDPEFAITPDTQDAVAEICRRLGGLPLAIELAAARIGVLDPAALAARLGDALDLLGPGPADAPERQRTLRATLDWSYALLTDPEREAFVALGAFAGGAGIEAAEEVTGAPLAVLEALVDKSLAIATAGRLQLLEPVRQYAAERVTAEARDRHGEHYLNLAERTRRELWLRGHASPVFETVHRERDNFRAALAASLEHSTPTAVKLAGALDPYWWLTHAEEEGQSWLEQALHTPAEPADSARAELAYARLFPPSSPKVIEHATAALNGYRELGDHAGIALALVRLATEHNVNANPEQAVALAGEAVEEARATNDRALVGHTLTRLAGCTEDIEDALALLDEGLADLRQTGATGQIPGGISLVAFRALYAERYDDADRLLTEALPAATAVQTPHTLALVHGNRGLARLLAGRVDEARADFVAQLRAARAESLALFYFEGLVGLAAAAADRGEDALAATLNAAAWENDVRPVVALEQPVYDRIDQRYLAAARTRLGAPGWERAAASGRRLSVAEAITIALTDV